MWLKNNSEKEWLGYNCGGGVIIDIKPLSKFEVKNERAAQLILRNLGAPNWITIFEGDVPMHEITTGEQEPPIILTPEPVSFLEPESNLEVEPESEPEPSVKKIKKILKIKK